MYEFNFTRLFNSCHQQYVQPEGLQHGVIIL